MANNTIVLMSLTTSCDTCGQHATWQLSKDGNVLAAACPEHKQSVNLAYLRGQHTRPMEAK
jgi:hypothetical protein